MKLMDAIEDSHWSCNSYWDDYFSNQTSYKDWCWHAFWNFIKKHNNFNCRSFDTHNSFVYFIKTSNNLLPTVDNLHLRTSLYDDFSCLLCLQEDESLSHLLTCPGTQDNFLLLEKEVTNKIVKAINAAKPRH